MDKQITLDDFCVLKEISKGGFGEIVLAHKHSDPSVLYAIKQVKKSEMFKKNLLQQIQAERDALAIAKSPFIVKIFYSFMSDGGASMKDIVNLVMEYMPGGDLKSLLSQMGAFHISQAALYIAEMAHAINYLHTRGIIHRDVKPDNMLISLTGHLKLTDFGLCSLCRGGHADSSSSSVSSILQVSDILTSSPYAGGCARTPGQVLSLTSHLITSGPVSTHGVSGSTDECPQTVAGVRPLAPRNMNQRLASCSGFTRTATKLVQQRAVAAATHRRSVPSLSSDQQAVAVGVLEPDDVTPVQIPRAKSFSRWMSMNEAEADENSLTAALTNDVFEDTDPGKDGAAPAPHLNWSILSRSSPKENVRGGSVLDDSWDELLSKKHDSSSSMRRSSSVMVMQRKRSIQDISSRNSSTNSLTTGLTMNIDRMQLTSYSPTRKKNGCQDAAATKEAGVRFSTPNKCVTGSPVSPPEMRHVAPSASTGSDITSSSSAAAADSQFTTPRCSTNAPLHTPFRAPMSSARSRRWILNRKPARVNGSGSVGNKQRVLGTPFYMAPESFVIGEHGTPIRISAAVDWWALGVCLFEFITGYLPFTGDTLHEIFTEIKLAHIDWPDLDPEDSAAAEDDAFMLPDEQIGAILALLHVNPHHRATLPDLKRQAIFSELDFDNLLRVEPLFKPVLDEPTDTCYFTYRNSVLLPQSQGGGGRVMEGGSGSD